MTTIGELLKQYQEDNELTVLEPGRYRLEVTGVKATKTDLRPVYKVVDGPFAGKRVMAGVLSTAGNASGIFFQNMAGFGLKQDFWASLGNVSTEEALKSAAVALKGRIADIELVQDEWKGEPRNKIAIGKIELVSAPAAAAQTAAAPGVPAAPAVAAAPAAPAVAAAPVVVAAPSQPVATPEGTTSPEPAAPAAPVAPAPVPAAPGATEAVIATAPVPPVLPTVTADDPGF